MSSERAALDLDLWRSWDRGGRTPELMEPLLDQFTPLLESQVRRYVGHVNIPDSALRAEFEDQFAKAARSFDPNRGVQLSTHVVNHLRGARRFVVQHQNMGRIPEHQINKIHQLTSAVHELQDELGRVPDHYALASRLNWSPTQIKRLRSGLRKDLLSSQFQASVGVLTPSRWETLKMLLPAELGERQKFVFKHTVGLPGAPILRAQEIARRLKVSPATVSKDRADIAKKLERYLTPTSLSPTPHLLEYDGGEEDD